MSTTVKNLVAANSIVGKNAIVLIRLNTAAATDAWTMLRDASYKIEPKTSIKETPNAVDGMLRTAGLNDYTLSVEGHTNPDDPIEEAIMPGVTIDFQAYRSSSYQVGAAGAVTNLTGPYWSGRVIVESCPIETGVDAEENWTLTALKQSGYLTLPDGTKQW